MVELVFVLSAAFLLDLIIGDPRYRFHPIRVIGRGILYFEKFLRGVGLKGKTGGILLVFMIEAASLIGYLSLNFTLHYLHPLLALVFNLFVCYSALALKDLIQHIRPVINALKSKNLSEARKALAMVVGRDARHLDEKEISRASVETLAENFVDGFFSPVFWYLTGGILAFLSGLAPVPSAISLMLVFKIASTLDSIVGYKNSRYLQFGWAGARLDDLMNFVPARLSIIVLFTGSLICAPHPLKGLRTALRDRLKHESPNSAHAESFVAGVFQIRLGGSSVYSGEVKNKPWLGKENADPEVAHISKTKSLLIYSAWITISMSIFILLLFR